MNNLVAQGGPVVKSPKHIVPMLVLLTLAVMLSGCSKNTTPTGLDRVTTVPALDQAPPALPSQIVGEWDSGAGRTALEWTPSSSANVASYQVYQYSPNPDRETAYLLVAETNATTTSYLLPLTPHETCYYRLRVTSTAGVQSGWSTPLPVVLGAPQGGDPSSDDGIILKAKP
jgi:hypothetical protein